MPSHLTTTCQGVSTTASGVVRQPNRRPPRARDTLPRRDLNDRNLRDAAVDLVARLTTLDRETATFADGQSRDVSAVVWATGYRDDVTWMHVEEAVDATGRFIQSKGASPGPGLFFVGRPWQMTQSSALVTGVGGDAEVIVARVMPLLQ